MMMLICYSLIALPFAISMWHRVMNHESVAFLKSVYKILSNYVFRGVVCSKVHEGNKTYHITS